MTQNPRISIVTPSFNQGSFLEECIDSILSQNYPDLEYVIMDGGSTDNSVDIIKKHEKYLTYWQSRPDKGQYFAINEGFRRTTGGVMTWLNSDDILQPDSLSIVAAICRERPSIEWITGRSSGIGLRKDDLYVFPSLHIWSRERYLRRQYKDPYIQQEGTFWRRSLWDRAGGSLDASISLAADLDLWARFFRCAQLYTVDSLLGAFRTHPGQKTATLIKEYLAEAEKIIDREIAVYEQSRDKTLNPAPAPITSEEVARLLREPAADRQREADLDLSIVLATRGRAQSLDRMLASLKDAAGDLRYEVVAIEGESGDDTHEVLQRHGVTRIFNERTELGEGRHTWPQLYNFGFSKARGRWGMYASDDIVFGRDCLSNAVSTLDPHGNEVAGGIFFYKDLHPEGPDWADYGICFTIGQHFLMNYGLLRTDFFRESGGLDESFRFYQADADISLKAASEGKCFIPLPGSLLVHNHGLGSKMRADKEFGRRDTDLLLRKWSGLLPVEIPHPSRLLLNDETGLAFTLPLRAPAPVPAMKDFWHGMAWLQKRQYHKTCECLSRSLSACDHWIVRWYMAKALIACGRTEEGKRSLELVNKAAPEFSEARELLARLTPDGTAGPIPNASGRKRKPKGTKRKRLVIQIRYGGLGDHLFYSHLPRIAKQTGSYAEVCVSNLSEFRQADFRRLIWELNPYVDGFCDEEGFSPEFSSVEEGMNLLDKIMLLQGMDDGKRFHEPEMYYKPEALPELAGKTIYDPNFISYVGELSADAVQSYFSRNRIHVDYQMKLRDRSLAISTFEKYFEASSFGNFCSVISSCDRLYCLASGTATLASALGRPATVFYGPGQKTMFHHSKLHTYTSPDDYGPSPQPDKTSRRSGGDEPLFILHTSEFYPPHPSEQGTMVQKISEGLAARGHYVEVATAKLPDRSSFEMNGVVVREFDVAGSLATGINGRDIQRYQEFMMRHPAHVVTNFAAQQWATDLYFVVLERTCDRRVSVVVPCGYSALRDAKTLRWQQFSKYFGQLMPIALPLYDSAVYRSAAGTDYEYALLHKFQNSVIIPAGPDGQPAEDHGGTGRGESAGVSAWEAVVAGYEDLYLRLRNAKQRAEKYASVPLSEDEGKAEERLRERLRGNFRDVPSLIAMAESAIRRLDYRKAQNCLTGAIALEPENPLVQELWANLHKSGGLL